MMLFTTALLAAVVQTVTLASCSSPALTLRVRGLRLWGSGTVMVTGLPVRGSNRVMIIRTRQGGGVVLFASPGGSPTILLAPDKTRGGVDLELWHAAHAGVSLRGRVNEGFP